MDTEMDNKNTAENTAEDFPDTSATDNDVAETTEGCAENCNTEGCDCNTEKYPEGPVDIPSPEQENIANHLPQDMEEDKKPENAENAIHLVAIPYINDGNSNVQVFCSSMFTSTPNESAVQVAEKYFRKCFNDDETPKWDGVLVCQFDFAKREIIKDDRNGLIKMRDFKSKWLWTESGAREDVTFNVKCTMPKVWASHFQSFLREMENYGTLGHSGQIAFFADGDGNFRPKFHFTKEFEPIKGIPSANITEKAELLFDAG